MRPSHIDGISFVILFFEVGDDFFEIHRFLSVLFITHALKAQRETALASLDSDLAQFASAAALATHIKALLQG